MPSLWRDGDGILIRGVQERVGGERAHVGDLGNSLKGCCCEKSREMKQHLEEGGGQEKFVLFYHDMLL